MNFFEHKFASRRMGIIVLAVFFLFALLAIFGVFFAHTGDRCLSSLISFETCPANVLAGVAHHLSLPHAFFNLIVAGYVFAGLILVAFFVRFIGSSILEPPLFFAGVQDISTATASREKISRWLALLENSPN
jgi:hypothetical protein